VELATHTVGLRDATLHRPSARVDRVSLRCHAKPLECEVAPVAAGRHAELRIELAEPAYGVAPAQSACLLDGDLIVGRATIA
jgi:tRNA-uridine 2-sulfurtransferase